MKRFKAKNSYKHNALKIVIYLIIFITIFFILSSKLFIGKSFLLLDFENTIKDNLLSFVTPEKMFNTYSDDYNYEEDLLVTKVVDTPSNKEESNEPLVYIYNTHQTETYADEIFENYNIKPNIMMSSYYLKDLLTEKGINTIVETKSVSDALKKNDFLYRESYTITRTFLEEIKRKYPSLKYFIDLHRDSSIREKTTTTINDKTYARVLFIVGLENKNYEKNLKHTTDLNNRIKKYNKLLSRGIYKKEGPGVNGIYNQDFDERALLIELGGQYNKITEITNTLDLLAPILIDFIKDDNYGI